MSTKDPSRRDLGSIARISAAEANRLIREGKAVLVDTRDRRYYEEAHAQGAISVPIDDFRGGPPPASLEGVASDQTIILYCT
jgi:rhodanese-related sulfurtransferase